MVRKRGNDSPYMRDKKRSTPLVNTTPSNMNEAKNILSDNILNLYRKEINQIQEASRNSNEANKIETGAHSKNEGSHTPVIVRKNEKDEKSQEKGIESSNVEKPPSSVKKIKKSSKTLTLKYSSITFKDVGGIDHILKEVFQMFMHLQIPQMFQELGISPVRGFLLHGPPGSGKTHLARAIAGELELPFIEVAATELVCGISGESEGKIRETFDEAIRVGRCILFIDEIDAISPKRENASGGMERRMVAQLLKCLDELNEKDVSSNVMVIGATNIPDSIDPALRRGGRFDRELPIGIPNEESRLKILEVLCKKLKLEPNFDLKWLAHHTPGFVGADLKTLISKAIEVGMLRMHHELKKKSVATIDIDAENVILSDDFSLEETQSWFKNLCVSDEDLENIHFKLEDFQVALRNCVPYCKREGFASVPDVSWEDIGALENVKKQLIATILRPVKNAKFFEENNLSYTKGILLYGPKGCGKTQLAKAIANECNINFLSVNGPELLSMYLGESEKAVRRCFERARHSAPCVIFFDEFDALCPSRSNSNSNAAAERVVNQLLTEMDGMQERKQVFVIAATNRVEKIDSAMLRPGRLEKLIYVDLPTPIGRKDILKSLTKNKTRPQIDEELSLDKIATDERCIDFTGADLAYLIREATTNAIEEIDASLYSSRIILKWAHFDKAFEAVRPSFSELDRKYFEKYRKHHSNH